MLCFDKAHNEALRRTSEQAVDQIAHGVTGDLFTAYRCLIEVGAIFQSSIDLFFLMKNIEHRLNGGICELAVQPLLNRLLVCRPDIPEHVHDLELQPCKMFAPGSRHSSLLTF